MTTPQSDIRKEKIGTLNELIEATRDSAEFYADAARSVENPNLRTLFVKMADAKNGLVGSMARQVRAEGARPAESGTFRGSLREIYTDVRASLSRDNKDYTYVSQLEQSEDRLLEAFQDVIRDGSAPAEVKESLRGYLPTVREHHDALRDRKWAMQSKH